jgi:hypothetical protein
MSIHTDTRCYDHWLSSQCNVDKHAVRKKHRRMRKNEFLFLRATYYRWARKIGEWCPELLDAPHVRAIGDIHTENYGTWRDGQGRLVWGVNDFDEAASMPCVLDLVRLATSAALAQQPLLSPDEACVTILDGYRRGLENPRPLLLEEHGAWMRQYVMRTKEQCDEFWHKVAKYPSKKPPRHVGARLKKGLPHQASITRFCTRTVGGGSLGRPRHVALAQWRGGHILHEAKALVPSAWDWAHDRRSDRSVLLELARGPYRSPDPFFDTKGKFIYRRIAPDSQKLELGDCPGRHLSRDVLRAMGFDLAAIHATHAKTDKIKADLKRRPRGWLRTAGEKATDAVRRDFNKWTA